MPPCRQRGTKMAGSIRYVSSEEDLKEGDILVLQDARGLYTPGDLFRFGYLIRENMIICMMVVATF